MEVPFVSIPVFHGWNSLYHHPVFQESRFKIFGEGPLQFSSSSSEFSIVFFYHLHSLSIIGYFNEVFTFQHLSFSLYMSPSLQHLSSPLYMSPSLQHLSFSLCLSPLQHLSSSLYMSPSLQHLSSSLYRCLLIFSISVLHCICLLLCSISIPQRGRSSLQPLYFLVLDLFNSSSNSRPWTKVTLIGVRQRHRPSPSLASPMKLSIRFLSNSSFPADQQSTCIPLQKSFNEVIVALTLW